MAEDIREFMRAKAIAHAAVVGHSMGSIVTQELALVHPEMVDHAVLVSSTASSAGNPAVTDYVLKEPLEGSWKRALEGKGYVYPKDFYHLKPLDADPNAADWIARNWDVDPLAPAGFLAPYVPETAASASTLTM